jgi:integrase
VLRYDRRIAPFVTATQGNWQFLLQRLLGHATATMTLDNYGHLYPDELDDVARQMGSQCVYSVRTDETSKAG